MFTKLYLLKILIKINYLSFRLYLHKTAYSWLTPAAGSIASGDYFISRSSEIFLVGLIHALDTRTVGVVEFMRVGV